MSSISTVYGPVRSWRLGMSLGIDVLCVDSICSFACVYCQLGKINVHTAAREIYVPTERVITDLQSSDWRSADVVTFSGSGEPTLAENLGEIIDAVKAVTGKPVVILTNSTMLGLETVRRDLSKADKVFCKLDAWNEELFRKVDRPVDGITLDQVVSGIEKFRSEFKGFLAIQTMLLSPMSESDIDEFSKILTRLAPDEVQLNQPSRAIPEFFVTASRGNDPIGDVPTRRMKTFSAEQLRDCADTLGKKTGFNIVTRD